MAAELVASQEGFSSVSKEVSHTASSNLRVVKEIQEAIMVYFKQYTTAFL
jgi:hypothetical protein